MKLIAKKLCNFGKRFYIGDEIPLEAVLDPKLQEKRGVLVIVDDEAAPAAPAEQTANPVYALTVCVHAEEGDLPLELTQEDLQYVLDILSSNAEDAEPLVKQMTNVDALIFLDVADSRKTIKTAAKARAKAITEVQEGVESAGDQ